MKKFAVILFSIIISLSLMSCVSAMAVEPQAEIEYYDYINNHVIIYIDGVAFYRFWDNLYMRYYFRPVPRHHYGYIRTRPLPPPHHHSAGPAHHRPTGPAHHHSTGSIHQRPTGPALHHSTGPARINSQQRPQMHTKMNSGSHHQSHRK